MKSIKRILLSILYLVAISSLAMSFSPPVKASPATIYVPDDYSTIQAAVDAASPGDTIIVRDGTYTENIDVNTDNLTIQSENGAEATIVQAANSEDHVFEVTADYVQIGGFTVRGTYKPEGQNSGIYLDKVNYCNISQNRVSDNRLGITVYDSSNNTLASNTVSDNIFGILVYGSTSAGMEGHNTLQGNYVLNNFVTGLELSNCASNSLSNNRMSDNRWNFGIELIIKVVEIGDAGIEKGVSFQ
jgi:parallel beta-helix repeat protein